MYKKYIVKRNIMINTATHGISDVKYIRLIYFLEYKNVDKEKSSFKFVRIGSYGSLTGFIIISFTSEVNLLFVK
jgi:hypothetical protein